ncbi:ChrR family anti-sigma-E factor [Telmatospirillum siberiense]|uniref:Anti-sigma factor n=1 Tax=Telmatospirillum siberiense TaxID=382514 RepID=A0A2N3PPF6_9PROT|nr:ChrR family anti-sigma-E factor [Telmatospirillum siberiense]PKU22268.1 anti-sigma factor [Telmatospirillum siberiense]
MNATFHPSDEFLMAYGAGSLDESSALLLATHLALCPRCRAEVGRIEALGGAIIEDLEPSDMGADALVSVLAKLDEPPPRPQPRCPAGGPSGLPSPLRDYLPADIDALPWKRLAAGIEQAILLQGRGIRARLLRIGAGITVPEHGHGGMEMTMVLRGGFSDLGRGYARGDVAMADPQVVHSPAADGGETCLCLAVTDAPLKLTGLVGMLVNPFLDL